MNVVYRSQTLCIHAQSASATTTRRSSRVEDPAFQFDWRYDLGDEGAEDSQYNDDNITGLGCCPCAMKGKAREYCGVFVRHAQERFSSAFLLLFINR